MNTNTHFVIGIRNKIPYKISGPDYIVTDNSDYTLELVPDAQWDGMEAKTILYAYDNGTSVLRPIIGNADEIPMIQTTGNLHIGVTAGEMKTSTWVSIPIKPSIRKKAGKQIPPPAPGVYDQIIGLINEMIAQADGRYPVDMSIRTIISSGQPDKYVLVLKLESGEELTETLPQMGLLPDDVVKFGRGKPSGGVSGGSSNYKQFYIDEDTSQLYIRTNKESPGEYIAVGGFLAGNGAPSATTVASQGNIYLNITTGELHRCTGVVHYPGLSGSINVTWEKIAKIPTKTSELENDAGFITKSVEDLAHYYKKSETLSKEEINALVSQIPKFSISVVDALPTSGISSTTIYLVKSGSGTDLYTEYIYANGAWEILGSQKVDLTGYATEAWVNDYVTAERIVELLGYTPAKEVGWKPDMYLGTDANGNMVEKDAPQGGTGGGIAEETDPTVPAWAKQPTKPSYTAEEVGAMPASTKIPGKTSDLENDSGYITIAVATLLNYYLKTEVYAKTETYSQTEVDNLISGLDKRLNAIADSEDVDLDQLSEIVAYIKANKSLIESITTDKVNVADIIDNLTTEDSKKPLSAAQGKALKALYDAIPTWAKAANKPTYSKSEVGLGNVDNVQQYSASNPPPYPVTSVNGQTGAVKLGASDVGALPTETKIPEVDSTLKVSGAAADAKVVGDKVNQLSAAIAEQKTEIDGKQPKGDYASKSELTAETTAREQAVADLNAQMEGLPNDETLIGNVAAKVPLVKVAEQPTFVNSTDEMTDTDKIYVMPDMFMWAYMLGENQPYTFTADDFVADALNTNGALLGNGTPNRIATANMIDLSAGTVSIYCPDPYQYIIYYYTERAIASYIGKTTFKSGNIDDVLNDTATSGTLSGAKYCRISLRDGASTTVDLSGRIDEFVANVIISQASGTTGESYFWQNTGYSYNQPVDYEDRIIALERALEGVENGTY